MTFEPLDVVVVPFPFTDRQAVKRRPAIVVSAPEFNRNHEQSVLAMVTSSTRDPWPSDVPLEDWRDANLTVPCRVRLKLFTLDHGLVLRRLGALSERDGQAVLRSLASCLATGAPAQ
ncbi:MAG: type II toxin-antitoxin system PemK/MazF family toxin [Chloroflexi bacterium]|nr:type II toxin-antitoxin system PemK/MazF family toxin [Chloroflexota bacterium]